MIVLDTTVLLYAIGSDHPLAEPARALVDAIGDGSVAATTTIAVIQEFGHTRARRRPRDDAVAHARRFAALLAPLLVTAPSELEPALRLYERHPRLDAFDAFLAATVMASDATAFVSADRGFAGIRGLRFVELGSPQFDKLLRR